MKIESMDDVKFLSELLFNGRDSFYPREDIIIATNGRILDLVKQLADLDPNQTLVYLEQTGTHYVEEPLCTLWRVNSWLNREKRKENLHKEVVEMHHKQQVTRAKIAILSTKIRRILNIRPTDRADFPNMLASQAITTNNKELVIAMGIKPEELDFWNEDMENPEEYL